MTQFASREQEMQKCEILSKDDKKIIFVTDNEKRERLQKVAFCRHDRDTSTHY